MTRSARPVGRPGDWFAKDKEDGVAYPCVHQSQFNGQHYHDPFSEGETSPTQFNKYLNAIKNGKVIITKTVQHPTKGHPQRKNYVALVEVANVNGSLEDGIHFDLVKRIKDYPNK